MENQIEVINLNSFKTGRGRGCGYEPNEARVAININKSYTMTFSSEFTKYIANEDKTKVNLAVNKLTGEVFLVFSKTDGFELYIKKGNRLENGNFVIQSRGVIFEIMDKLGVNVFNKEEMNTFVLTLSENLSKNRTFITIGITLK